MAAQWPHPARALGLRRPTLVYLFGRRNPISRTVKKIVSYIQRVVSGGIGRTRETGLGQASWSGAPAARAQPGRSSLLAADLAVSSDGAPPL